MCRRLGKARIFLQELLCLWEAPQSRRPISLIAFRLLTGQQWPNHLQAPPPHLFERALSCLHLHCLEHVLLQC